MWGVGTLLANAFRRKSFAFCQDALGVVAGSSWSCQPGRIFWRAATSVHVNRQYRLVISLARRSMFAWGESLFRQTHLYPHLFRKRLVVTQASIINPVPGFRATREGRHASLGPNPASRRVSQGLETTEQTKLLTRPHPASRRWTAGLTTRHDKV